MSSIPHLRRKLPKDLPKLPMSVFTPPNSSAGDAFPLPPSPSALHPAEVVDANIVTNDLTYSQWKKEAGQQLSSKIKGVVLSLPNTALLQSALAEYVFHFNSDKYYSTTNIYISDERINPSSQVISLIIPFDLEKPDHTIESLIANTTTPVSLSTVFTKNSPEAVEGLKWALKQGKPVDIDVQGVLSDSLLEGFEDMIAKASADLDKKSPVILCKSCHFPHFY